MVFTLPSFRYDSATDECVHPTYGSIKRSHIVEIVDNAHRKGWCPLSAQQYMDHLRPYASANESATESSETKTKEEILVSFARMTTGKNAEARYKFPIAEILMLGSSIVPGLVGMLYNPQDAACMWQFGCEVETDCVNIEVYIRYIPDGFDIALNCLLMMGLDIVSPVFIQRFKLTDCLRAAIDCVGACGKRDDETQVCIVCGVYAYCNGAHVVEQLFHHGMTPQTIMDAQTVCGEGGTKVFACSCEWLMFCNCRQRSRTALEERHQNFVARTRTLFDTLLLHLEDEKGKGEEKCEKDEEKKPDNLEDIMLRKFLKTVLAMAAE